MNNTRPTATRRSRKNPNPVGEKCHLVPDSVLIDGEDWKAIGRGITFAVYSNGKEVVKVPLTPEQLFELHQLLNKRHVEELQEAQRRYRSNLRQISLLRQKMSDRELPAILFNDPDIQRNGWVYQVKMTPLIDYWSTASKEMARRSIDESLAVIADLVRWGAFVSYVSLSVDFAIDQERRVKLMGFGGIVFDHEGACEAIRARPWRSSISGAHMMPELLRDYFVSKAERLLTEHWLDKHWATKHSAR